MILKSFNGIGDLLFTTPTLRIVKETYDSAVKVKVNTNHPSLLLNNPFVDEIGSNRDEGLFMSYPDPIHMKRPTQHHILTDWQLVCKEFGLTTPKPNLMPELYTERLPKRESIGVQTIMTGKYGGKKDWPYAKALVEKTGWEPIPKFPSVERLAKEISSYQLVVCPEGGIMHMATALGVPCVAIFGGFIDPEWTGYDANINLACRLPCSDDCYNHHPCKNSKKHECWRRITVSEVIKTVNLTLELGLCCR